MNPRLAKVLELGAPILSDEQRAIFSAVKTRLSKLGWAIVFDHYGEEGKIFENLIPPPDTTFSVIAPTTGERRAVALHFTEAEEGVRYVCTMQLANGALVQECGQLKRGTEDVTFLAQRDEWKGPPNGNVLSAARKSKY